MGQTRLISCFLSRLMPMAAEAVALAEKQVTELRVALAQNHNQIRNCQQQARRQALAVRNGGLSVQAGTALPAR